jgi:hypothetical protein
VIIFDQFVPSCSNWHLIGTYKPPQWARGRQLINPKADEEQMYRAFCLLGEHDAPRISYIYSHMDAYDFSGVSGMGKRGELAAES